MLRIFCEPETGGSTPEYETYRSNFTWFLLQNLLGNQKYFERAIQVNFQFIFSTKFTGKIKSILKLAMWRIFCEPETERFHSSMQNMRFTFQLIFSTKFTGKIKTILKLAGPIRSQDTGAQRDPSFIRKAFFHF